MQSTYLCLWTPIHKKREYCNFVNRKIGPTREKNLWFSMRSDNE